MTIRLRTTPAFDEEVENVVAQAARGQVTVDREDHVERSWLLQGVVARLDSAVVVSVPTAPDQVERMLLDLGAQLGHEALRDVDARLRGDPDHATAVLDEYLKDRPLVVDGRDLLGDWGANAEDVFRQALAEPLDKLSAFLDRRATVLVTCRSPRTAVSRSLPPLGITTDEQSSDISPWELFDAQVGSYQLWLSLRLLEGRSVDEQLPAFPPSADTLRTRLLYALPHQEARLLRLLCTHERTLPHAIVDDLSLRMAVSTGAQLGLWYEDVNGLWVSRDWCRWWRDAESEPVRIEHHRELAAVFSDESGRGDPALLGLSTLEAHRHFVLAGDDAQAKQYARYGGGVLIARARSLSYQHKYHEAAALYAFVVDSAKQGDLPVPPRLSAYAIHYMHFNRYRAGPGAPLDATINGYERSLELWPENALFWSRLARAHFYEDEPVRALEVLDTARQRVPAHPQKETLLTARTVFGLLRSKRLLEAALVWAGHQALNQYEASALRELLDALNEGWETRWLRIPNGPELAFNRPVRVRLDYLRAQRRWLAELPELDASAAGSMPAQALAALVEALREETRAFVRALTHRLTTEDRLRKQRLIATIDIVVSRLDAAVSEHVWVLGELEQSDDGLKFRSHDGTLSALSPELSSAPKMDRYPRFARFATDPIGRAQGAVLELDEPFRGSTDELWTQWRKRISGGA